MSPKHLPRIGTAGWSYPHWNGIVYPAGRGTGPHPLDQLAKQFDLVEINSSFYQSLKPELVKYGIDPALIYGVLDVFEPDIDD